MCVRAQSVRIVSVSSETHSYIDHKECCSDAKRVLKATTDCLQECYTIVDLRGTSESDLVDVIFMYLTVRVYGDSNNMVRCPHQYFTTLQISGCIARITRPVSIGTDYKKGVCVCVCPAYIFNIPYLFKISPYLCNTPIFF